MSSSSPHRETVSFEPHNSRFLVRNRAYNLQYSHIYSSRLKLLRPLLVSAVEKRWRIGEDTKMCNKIIELYPEPRTSSSKDWVVFGCIYKDMSMRPSVLDTYSGVYNACDRIALQRFRSTLSPALD